MAHHTALTYHPMHMHLHAACDHGASMALHMHNARSLGMNYIWFTDHDTRTGRKKYPVTGFTFDTPQLMKEDPSGGSHGFLTEDEKLRWTIDPETQSLHLCLDADNCADWTEGAITFYSSGTRHTSPLSAEVTLKIALSDFFHSDDIRIIFDVRLSQRPPDCQKAHLLYVLGNPQGLEAPHTQIIPLTSAGQLCMPLSEDASENPRIGGRDNAFDTLTIRLQCKNGAHAAALLRNFQIHTRYHFEDAHRELKKTAAIAGVPYGITPFVSFELSGAGEHKNCYGTHVPTLDYYQKNYSIPVWEAVSHIKSHGGIFAINHPFAIGSLKRKNFSPVERMQVLSQMQASLTANSAYGAHLMEVGFPEGRNGFSLEEYLLLWDMLSQSGVFLTGYGSSDSHRDNIGWFSGNNFATWIGVPEDLAHPIPEAAFLDAMKAGRVYTGDPVLFRGTASFRTTDGHPMGSVFLTESTSCVNLIFTATQVRPGWTFRLIENGRPCCTREIQDDTFTRESCLTAGITSVNFQRAELWDETGRCVLITNPIYLINTRLFTGVLPCHRIPEEENK